MRAEILFKKLGPRRGGIATALRAEVFPTLGSKTSARKRAEYAG